MECKLDRYFSYPFVVTTNPQVEKYDNDEMKTHIKALAASAVLSFREL